MLPTAAGEQDDKPTAVPDRDGDKVFSVPDRSDKPTVPDREDKRAVPNRDDKSLLNLIGTTIDSHLYPIRTTGLRLYPIGTVRLLCTRSGRQAYCTRSER